MPEELQSILSEEVQQKAILDNAEFKFNNCDYRSNLEEIRNVRTCVCPHTTEIKGYECAMHRLFPLDKNFCGPCQEFKQKELNG